MNLFCESETWQAKSAQNAPNTDRFLFLNSFFFRVYDQGRNRQLSTWGALFNKKAWVLIFAPESW